MNRRAGSGHPKAAGGGRHRRSGTPRPTPPAAASRDRKPAAPATTPQNAEPPEPLAADDPAAGDPAAGDPAAGDLPVDDLAADDRADEDPTGGDPTAGDLADDDSAAGVPAGGDLPAEDPTGADSVAGAPADGELADDCPAAGDLAADDRGEQDVAADGARASSRPRPAKACGERPRPAYGAQLTVGAVYGAAGALTLVALGWTQWHGVRQPGVALAFGALVAVGEALRRGDGRAARRGTGLGQGASEPGPAGRECAPLAAAGALAYALLEGLGGLGAATGGLPGTAATGGAPGATAEGGLRVVDNVLPGVLAGGDPGPPGAPPASLPGGGGLQVIAVVAAAGLVGLVPQIALGRPVALDRLARRVLCVAMVAACCQPLSGLDGLTGSSVHGPYQVGYLLVLLTLAAGCDAVLAAALTRARTGRPYVLLLAEEARELPRTGTAVGATGVAMALAVTVAGLWALPVVCVPLLPAQHAFRRHADVRATYRQTIASLARSTEVAGYTPAGHAHRVATLSGAVGREMGLSGRELAALEHAALLHDVGQLSLLDPLPAGATERLPAAERRRIARLGGAVVRQTGAPEQVALIVERQAEPYRQAPPAARVLRVANAYAELTAAPGARPGEPLRALEKLRSATAREIDPAVVEALARVLAHGGTYG